MHPNGLAIDVGSGVWLNVRRWSGGEGVPFVLVHGLSSNARLWDQVAVRLADAGHPACAVDLRSHGDSDSPDAGYDTATAATDVAAVATALGLSRAVYAGQSWGGNVVVELAATRPDLVSALALVDGGWLDLTAEFDSWEECEAALRPPEVDRMRPGQLRDLIRRGHPDWSDEAVEATLANLRVNDHGHLRRRLPIDKHMRIVRSMWEDPPWPYLAKISVPVLLMPALSKDEEPAAQRRAQVNRAAQALPTTTTIREFAGADHDLHAQHPGEVADDLMSLARRAAA